MSTTKPSTAAMYYIQIIEKKTNICEEQMEDPSERGADRIKRGVEINLNHSDYKVIVTKTKAVKGERVKPC